MKNKFMMIFILLITLVCACASVNEEQEIIGENIETKQNIIEEHTNDNVNDNIIEEHTNDNVNDNIIEDDISSDEYKFSEINTDSGYKMFYGRWKVTEKVGESIRYGSQDISDIIGEEFYFSKCYYSFTYQNEEIKIDYPHYQIEIIPLYETTSYLEYMPKLIDMGFTGSYTTIFTVRIGDPRDYYDLYFFIKDDDTLVAFYQDAFIELKRLEHIENYKMYYRPV